MRAGDNEAVFSLFYAAGKSAQPRVDVRQLSPNAIAISGALNAVIGVGSLSLDMMTVRAAQFLIGPQSVVLVDGEQIACAKNTAKANGVHMSRPLIKAGAPINLSLNIDAGAGVVEAKAPCELLVAVGASAAISVDGKRVSIDENGVAKIDLSSGRHAIKGDLSRVAEPGTSNASTALILGLRAQIIF